MVPEEGILERYSLIVSGSASGIYGDAGARVLTENDPRGKGFLAGKIDENTKFAEGDILPRSGSGSGRPKEAGEGEGEDAFRWQRHRNGLSGFVARVSCDAGDEAQRLKDWFLEAVDRDTDAFNEYLAARDAAITALIGQEA